MLRNRAKRKYGTVAQEIQFSEFYRTAIIFFTLHVTPLSVFSAIVAGKVGMDGLMKWKLRVPVYPRTRPFSYICISLTPKFHPIIPF